MPLIVVFFIFLIVVFFLFLIVVISILKAWEPEITAPVCYYLQYVKVGGPEPYPSENPAKPGIWPTSLDGERASVSGPARSVDVGYGVRIMEKG